MNWDSLLRKFKISMSKYLEYKYDIDCEFHQFIIEDKLKYSLCTLNGDWLRSHIHIVKKDINKYWNSFVKAYKNNNYKKAYRICKYIRKIAKSYNK